jgi:CubicO group peptidase (beta-lactamase class C family)
MARPSSAGLGRASAQFAEQQRSGRTPSGVMVARQRGEIVLAEAVGLARGSQASADADPGTAAPAPVPMTVETTFQVMSVSKAVVAFAVAVLEDRGLIEVAAPVATVWPAFAVGGKGDVTVLDVLTHRSGLVLEDLVRDRERWRDWDAVTATIAASPLDYPRGTLAYEAYTFGWILGEVIRRVSGRSIDEFVAEMLAPEIQSLRFRGPRAEAPSVARNDWLGDADYRFGGLRLADGFETTNNGFSCFEALIPGAGLLADAPALTAFYDMLLRGGVLASGRRLIRSEVLHAYLTRATSGRDRITGAWVTLGRGFATGWALPHPFGWWRSGRCFGHPGGFGMVAFADPDADVSVAILTTANRGVSDLVRRFAPLAQAIRRAASATKGR